MAPNDDDKTTSGAKPGKVETSKSRGTYTFVQSFVILARVDQCALSRAAKESPGGCDSELRITPNSNPYMYFYTSSSCNPMHNNHPALRECCCTEHHLKVLSTSATCFLGLPGARIHDLHLQQLVVELISATRRTHVNAYLNVAF